MEPRIQYVTTADGVSLAYYEMGEGYPVVNMPGPPFTHVQLEAQMPSYSGWNQIVAENRRLIRFDSRGTGLSDREVPSPSIEDYCADIDAIVDHLDIGQFALIGSAAGGIIAIRYALDRPDRVTHLALWDGYPSGKAYASIPQVRAFLAMIENDYEMFSETLANVMFGWDAGESARDYARFIRECASKEDALRFFDVTINVDLTPELSNVTQPTLVLQHKALPLPDIQTARLLASRIPNAHLVLLEGTWNRAGKDETKALEALDGLIGGNVTRSAAATDTVAAGVATILFTDIEGSTTLTQRLGDARGQDIVRAHNEIVRQALASHGGNEIKHTGDGIMASFPTASGALDAAIAIQRGVNDQDDATLQVRIGLNAGEPVVEERDLFGTAVQLARRICDSADAGQILASNVVRELAAGKGFLFADRGETALRGFEDPVRVYEVSWRE
jgi:class 3 adenylate cyclase/pimeloyl-ACP methyl ester carboxylesterase